MINDQAIIILLDIIIISEQMEKRSPENDKEAVVALIKDTKEWNNAL